MLIKKDKYPCVGYLLHFLIKSLKLCVVSAVVFSAGAGFNWRRRGRGLTGGVAGGGRRVVH